MFLCHPEAKPKDLLHPHKMPVIRAPGAHRIGGALPLPFHFLGCQLHKLVGDIAEVRHRRIDGNGALVDQVDGIRSTIVVGPYAQHINMTLIVAVPIKGLCQAEPSQATPGIRKSVYA